MERIRELSVQAANGTLTDDQRAAINAEAQELIAQIDETATNTQFNGQNLIDQNQTIDLGTTGTNALSLQESTANSLGVDTIDLSTQAGAVAAIDAADRASSTLLQNRSSVGGQMNRFADAINLREIQAQNDLASQSAIRDADFARLTMQQSQAEILLQGGASALMQSNVTSQTALSLLG